MRSRFKPWAKPYLEEHPELVFFEASSLVLEGDLDLEIGAGKGDFALSYASNNPSKRLLALERDISITGLFAKKAVEAKIVNLTILATDFDLAYEELKRFSFKKIFLNFSDPWPKKRHEKRRLTFAPRLSKIASLLEENGQILMKTDNDNLYLFTKEQALSANLKIIEDQEDYQTLAENDYLTEYERNFRKDGKKIHRLVIRK